MELYSIFSAMIIVINPVLWICLIVQIVRFNNMRKQYESWLVDKDEMLKNIKRAESEFIYDQSFNTKIKELQELSRSKELERIKKEQHEKGYRKSGCIFR